MSQYWTILTSCKTALTGASGLGGATLDIRRRPWFDAERDTLPFLCICPLSDTPGEEQFGGKIMMGYPVLFAFFQANNSCLSDPVALQTLLDAREAIRRLHDVSLAGASNVFDSEYEPSPAFDLGGLDRLYDISLQRIVFKSQEPREPS